MHLSSLPYANDSLKFELNRSVLPAKKTISLQFYCPGHSLLWHNWWVVSLPICVLLWQCIYDYHCTADWFNSTRTQLGSNSSYAKVCISCFNVFLDMTSAMLFDPLTLCALFIKDGLFATYIAQEPTYNIVAFQLILFVLAWQLHMHALVPISCKASKEKLRI